MKPRVGDWWSVDRGVIAGPAHRVAAVLPDVTRFVHGGADDKSPTSAAILLDGYDRWIPLCAAGLDRKPGQRAETAVADSKFAGWPDAERCSECEVRSAALDAWLAEQ